MTQSNVPRFYRRQLQGPLSHPPLRLFIDTLLHYVHVVACYMSAEPFLTSQGIKNVLHPPANVLSHQIQNRRPLLTYQV